MKIIAEEGKRTVSLECRAMGWGKNVMLMSAYHMKKDSNVRVCVCENEEEIMCTSVPAYIFSSSSDGTRCHVVFSIIQDVIVLF